MPRPEEAQAGAELDAREGRLLLRGFYYLKADERLSESPLFRGQGKQAERLAQQALESYAKALRDPAAAIRHWVTAAALAAYLGETQQVEVFVRGGARRAPQLRPAFGKLYQDLTATAGIDPAAADDPELRSLLADADGGPLVLIRIYDLTAQPGRSRRVWRQVLEASRPFFLRGLYFLASLALLGLVALAFLLLLIALRKRIFRRRALPATWTLGGAVETLVLWLFLSSVVGLACLPLVHAFMPLSGREGELAAAFLGSALAGLLALCWFRFGVRGGSARGWLGVRPLALFSAVGAAALIAAVAHLLLLGGEWLSPEEQIRHPLLPEMVSAASPLLRALFIALACGIAPAFEEILFRGILFGALRRRWPFAVAALVSGFVFALGHFQVGAAALPAYVFIGFALASVYEYSGSLLPPILVHAGFNALGLVVVYLFFLS
jgi:hypothetical protein